MAAVTIRSLTDETHRALKARAKANGRSTEAEMRAILEDAVLPKERIKAGTALQAFGKRWESELSQIDFDSLRDKTPATGADFE